MKLIQMLLDKKVDVNAVDSDGNTALFHAVAVSTSETAKTVVDPIDIVSLLLTNKANAKTVKEEANKKFYEIAAKEITPKTYQVLKASGASF